jgi:hypothetical protein
VLELVGVAYGPRPAPVSTEVLKKRKADNTEKVLAKHLKAPEKKRAGATNVVAVHEKKMEETTKVTVVPEKKRMKTTKVVMA